MNRGLPPNTPRMPVAVDGVVLTVDEGRLKVLLIRRAIAPAEKWALPGGFVRETESLREAVKRELAEEAGVRDVYLEQLYTFGRVDRDERGRVVTVAYYALAPQGIPTRAGSDAEDVRWFPVGRLPGKDRLAFDHRGIIAYAVERLRNKLWYTTVGFELLPSEFTLSQLQEVYEAILGEGLDASGFRQRILALGIVEPVDRVRQAGRGRPAQLFRFVPKRSGGHKVMHPSAVAPEDAD